MAILRKHLPHLRTKSWDAIQGTYGPSDRVGLLFVSSVNPSASVVLTSCFSVHLDFISSPSSHFVGVKMQYLDYDERSVLARKWLRQKWVRSLERNIKILNILTHSAVDSSNIIRLYLKYLILFDMKRQ